MAEIYKHTLEEAFEIIKRRALGMMVLFSFSQHYCAPVYVEAQGKSIPNFFTWPEDRAAIGTITDLCLDTVVNPRGHTDHTVVFSILVKGEMTRFRVYLYGDAIVDVKRLNVDRIAHRAGLTVIRPGKQERAVKKRMGITEPYVRKDKEPAD